MNNIEKILSEKQLDEWGLPAYSSIDTEGQVRGIVVRWSSLLADFKGLSPDNQDAIFNLACDTLIHYRVTLVKPAIAGS